MARFVVDSDVISTKTAEARNIMDRISSDVQGMTLSLQDLENTWTGSASGSFQATLQNWRATQLQVEQSINQINSALQQAGVNYAQTEASNASMFMG